MSPRLPKSNNTEELYQSRLAALNSMYDEIHRSLETLSHVLPQSWIDAKIPASIKRQIETGTLPADFQSQVSGVNTAFTTYIKTLHDHPDFLPDDKGGDRAELKRNFDQIKSTLHALESLLEKPITSDSFVNRLQAGDDDKYTAVSLSTANISTEERGNSKKKTDYILPGIYEWKIQKTVSALSHYTTIAAPLMGVILQDSRLQETKNPQASFPEQKDFKIKHSNHARPEIFGVSKAWTEKLNLTLSMFTEPPSPAPPR